MKFSTTILIFFITTVSSIPVKRDVDPNLIPEFGVTPGQNPTGTGDCDGINGIKIPCDCPPNRQVFIDSLNANVAAGKAVHNPSVLVSFPSDNSQASQEARINAAIVTLQNLNGSGIGCPAASTNFLAHLKARQDDTPQDDTPSMSTPASDPASTPASAPASTPAPDPASTPAPEPASTPAPDPASTPASAPVSVSVPEPAFLAAPAVPKFHPILTPGTFPPPQIPKFKPRGKRDLATLDKLTPQFGVTPGSNPTGTGDCTGINNIKIPCSCPPDRTAFLESLQKNIAAGEATNNPSIKLTFPTDDSKQSQVARIQAAIVTLQNLNGPGKGCPAASTTFSAQLAAALG